MKQTKDKKTKDKQTKDKQIEELTALVKKVQADFENYTKRIEKEQAMFKEYAEQNLMKELLPVLDSFELAMKDENVKAIYNQLWQILSSQGLQRIEALDKKFDPYLHEVLMQEDSKKEKGTVLEELQAGYKFKEIVIRPAKVKVAKGEKNARKKTD